MIKKIKNKFGKSPSIGSKRSREKNGFHPLTSSIRNRSRRKKPEKWLRIAKERINILFEQAELRPRKGDRYVYLARKIAMKYNLRIPPNLKRKFCHRCYSYFKDSHSYSVRTNPQNKSVEYTCKKCNGTTRYGYSREKNSNG